MNNKDLNRIKVVLVEHKRTNKWLAEQLGGQFAKGRRGALCCGISSLSEIPTN